MKSAVRILLPSIVIILVFGLLTAMAAKPQEVIEKSNGFPSGPHSNLIIHGKNADVFICISPSPGGNSLFVPECTVDLNGDKEGHVTIQYIQNKKASLTELTVLDSCAMDDGMVKVQLPDKVMLDDGSTQPTDGHWVYAKIGGKPNHGDYCDPSTLDPSSNIILYPNVVVEACNDPGNPDFGDLTNCPDDPLEALGVITNNLYVPDPYTGEFVRFDTSGGEKGKGRSKGKDITRLFIYVGWVVDEMVDISGPDGIPDGVIDDYDVPDDALLYASDYDLAENGGNDDGIIQIEEWLTYQSELDPPMAWYFSPDDNTFIHEIADLVITEQGLKNRGTKNLQIRFYPRSTTEFH
jgi:hypothetical protein